MTKIGSIRAAAFLGAVALGMAACGSTPPGSTASAHGTADVAYAGSLEKLQTTVLGPDFAAASGDHFTGPPVAGSLALAQGILAGEYSPGVFLSVGAKAIKLLWPAHRSTFALGIATDPLVVAYSASSPDASQLDEIASGSKPLRDLFTLMEQPGFKLGRTDPNQDPQGEFFELMLNLAQRELHLPSGTAQKILGTTANNSAGNSSQIYSETALPSVISTGSVDAGSAYLPEALQYHLKYIVLPASLNFSAPADAGLYSSVSMTLSDGTVVSGEVVTLYVTLVKAPSGHPFTSADQAADNAYVAFLLSSKGRSDLTRAGYTLEAPLLHLESSGATASSVLPGDVLAAYKHLGGRISTS